MPKNKGFSAIELMIVIGILAIITAIGVPAYMNWIPNYKLGRDTVNLKADLEMAKLVSKRENVCIGVLFANNATSGEYTIFKDNGIGANACNYTKDAGEQIVKFQELSPGDTFGNPGGSYAGVPFLFRGNGEVSIPGSGPGGASFTDQIIPIMGYAKSNNIKTIEVQLLGRIVID